MTNDNAEIPTLETLDLINTEINGRLARQSTALSQIDTKAAILGGLAVAGTQFLASKTPSSTVLQVLAFVFFGVAFTAAVLTYSLARFTDVPDPRRLVRIGVYESKSKVLTKLIAARVETFEQNFRKHRRKVVLWWISVGALALAILLSAASLVHDGPHEQPEPRPSGRGVVGQQ